MSYFDVDSRIVKEYAFGGVVDYLDEMKIRYNRYVDDFGDFEYEVEEDDRRVFVDFENSRGSSSFEIEKRVGSVNTWAEPFDWVEFSNVSLANVILGSDVAWAGEYILATYWGEPATTNMDDFVRDNVRILQEYYVPNKSAYSLPESAVDENEFDTTDVRTYTDTEEPVPWARGSILVLYEDWSICDRILNHDECRLSGDVSVSPPYPVKRRD